MIKARPEVEAMTPYMAPLEGRRDLLRLDFNESTVGPSPAVVDAIRHLPPDAYSTYPEYAGLNEAYASSIGVPASHVEAFNGVDAAIRAVFDAYGERGSVFLTTTPTFGYYAPCAQQQGMVIDEIPYPKDLSFPLEALARRLEARPRLCFICNPNNPTGTLLATQTIVALARSAPDTLMVVDRRAAAGIRDRPLERRRAAAAGDRAVRHQHVRGDGREGGAGRRGPHEAIRGRGAGGAGMDDRGDAAAGRALRR
jgi:histidinol-phosphate aminotransferase